MSDAPTPSTPASGRRWLGLGLRLGATALLFAVLASKIDWRAASGVLVTVSPLAVLLAVLLIVLIVGMGALRWWLVSRALGLVFPLRQAFRLYMIAGFVNQAMPSTLGGDALRIYLMRREGVDIGLVTRSVVLDRVCALLGLGGLVVLTQPLVPGAARTPQAFGVFALLLCGLLLGAAIFASLSTKLQAASWAPLRALGGLAHALRRLILAPRQALPAVGLTVFGFSLAGASTGVLGLSMGLPAAFWHYLVLCPPVFLLSVLPLSVAGWGVREAGMVVALGYVGVSPEQALAVGVAFGIANLIAVLPGGGLWLASR